MSPNTEQADSGQAASGWRDTGRRRQFVQMLIGLLALPLSVLPFLAYGLFTPEGRLLRDRLVVAVAPPKLPALTAAEQDAAADAPRYAGKVMALVYHGVGSTHDGEGNFVISPGRFAEHLAVLRAAGLQTVTAAEVARAFTTGASLPDNAVMITFDDGRADALMYADPLLDQAGMKATMFVISHATDRPNLYYAGWDRIEQAARSGRWDIEAHTDDAHREEPAAGGQRLPLLTSLEPGESLDGYRARIGADLDRNRAVIERHVGQAPVAFAYPFGAYGGDRTNDPGIRDILQEEISRRFAVAFEQDDQETVGLLDPTQDRTHLRRLEVGDWSGTELLARIARAAGTAPGIGSDGNAVPARPVTPPETAPAGPARPGKVAPRTGPRSPVSHPTTTVTGPVPTTVLGSPADTSTDPSTTTTEPFTTTTTSGPSTTTTTGPPTTTTTEPPPTTTTSRPPGTTTTTTTTGPSTTTTTQPGSCRGKGGGKPCHR